MYKQLTSEDVKKFLNVKLDYKVEGLLVVGSHPKEKEYIHLYEALDKLGIKYIEEKIEDSFFGDIKVFVINGKRFWFDVVYGTAYLSEVIHIACLLGSKANILLGTCGGLQQKLNMGDSIIPIASYGNESSTRMYQREKTDNLFYSNDSLNNKIKNNFIQEKTIYEGNLVTVQAMLAETKEDVDLWSEKGYLGVDMESATLFAISSHFNTPSASLLFVADNLVKGELVTDDSFQSLKVLRSEVRKENYFTALKTLVSL